MSTCARPLDLCVCRHPNHEWSVWLRSLPVLGHEPLDEATLLEHARHRVSFVAPPSDLVYAYVIALRFGADATINADGALPNLQPCHKGGTIRVYVGAITATCGEFDATPTTKTEAIKSAISEFLDHDGTDSSAAFDMVNDLPRLYGAVWSMYGWSFDTMLMHWTMFLIAMCLMARASDLTTFCPLIEDINLPDSENCWDADGYPQYIDIGLRNWKWRSKKNRGKR